MARTVENTKKQLMAAATAEFAARGPHGTTMEQIAKRAGVNKERLYTYYGDKLQVFAAVLAEELAKVADAVPIDVLEKEGPGEYAGRCFDYLDAHPELIRLLHWEALMFSDAEVPDEARRTDYYRQKVDAVTATQVTTRETGQSDAGQPCTGQPDAAHLYALLLAVAHWWFALPQLARMITGSSGEDRAERENRRAAVVEAATRIAAGPQAP
jgi:AcrR family transcriptional regulator